MRKKLIVIFVILIALAIVAFDIYLVYSGGKEATISLFLWYSAKEWPIIPFVFGLLMGHLFWQNYGKDGDK